MKQIILMAVFAFGCNAFGNWTALKKWTPVKRYY